MFFPQFAPTMINITKVISASARRPDRKVILRLKGEDTETIDSDEWAEALRNHVVHMTAALPGTYVLWSATAPEADGFWTAKRPVISWAHSADGCTYPVTFDGVNDNEPGTQTVLLPDGMVVTFEQAWESFAEWEAEKKKDFDAKQPAPKEAARG